MQKYLYLSLKPSLFWDVTRRRLVVRCRLFRTSYRPHLQESSIGPTGFPETLSTNYTTTTHNIADERRPLNAAAAAWNLPYTRTSLQLAPVTGLRKNQKQWVPSYFPSSARNSKYWKFVETQTKMATPFQSETADSNSPKHYEIWGSHSDYAKDVF